jgi:hypothetical protein
VNLRQYKAVKSREENQLKIKNRKLKIFSFLLLIFLTGCGLLATPTPQPATVMVNFDLGQGGSGFAATLYAQEVTSGKTFKGFYAAGSHGLVVLPTSAPVKIVVDAPGTYVFYATLVEAPDDYHYGATGCKPAEDCPSAELVALDVAPGGTYQVTISDRSAALPTPNAPVSVPWKR